MPGVGGVQHVVGELRPQFGQAQADFLVTRLGGGIEGDAAALKILQRVVNYLALRAAKRIVIIAVAQAFNGAIQPFVLAEVAAVGGECGQERFVGGAPFVGAGDGVQVGDGRDRLGEAVFEALQRLHQPVPSEIAARDEGFYRSAVFIKYLRDDGGVLRADGGEGGYVGGLVERVGIGHGESLRLKRRRV